MIGLDTNMIVRYLVQDDPVQAEPSGAERKEVQKGRRGRPKGSKNRKTLEREALAATGGGADQGGSGGKRGPGRPKGSKNRKTLEREAQARAEAEPRAKAAGPLSRADRQPPAAGPARAEGLHPVADPLREDGAAQRRRHSILHRIKMQAAAAEMLLPAKTRKTEKINM